MGQHNARRGTPSWYDCPARTVDRDPDPVLPPVSPIWDSLEPTQPGFSVPEDVSAEARRGVDDVVPAYGVPQWQSPRPRPRPRWSLLDFVSYMHFRHPPAREGICACGACPCDVRAKLDLIDWGPNGPPS